MAGCGCAGLLGAISVIGIVIAVLEDPDVLKNEFRSDDYFLPERAVASIDSLRALDLRPLRRRPPDDGLTLHGRGSGNGAATAIRLWIDTGFYRPLVPFGDTLPDGDRRKMRWTNSETWNVVDSLRAAALRPWDLRAALGRGQPTDSGYGVFAPRVFTTTRAMLARARVDGVRGKSGEADTLTRAVITIGRYLQGDSRLYHVLLGARVEREALYVLRAIEEQGGLGHPSPRTLAALSRADDVVTAAEGAYRFLTAAGALPHNCPALADLVRDPALPLAVRQAAVHAIGFGWAFSSLEQASIDDRRGKALAGLADAELPPELHTAVRVARSVVDLPLFKRFVVGAQQQFIWRAWRTAG